MMTRRAVLALVGITLLAAPAQAQVIGWASFPPAATNYTVRGSIPWTKIATVRMIKKLSETQLRCDFMMDIRTQQPHAVYVGLWVRGKNLASGAQAGALPNSSAKDDVGLIVISFSNLVGYNLPAGQTDIDIMAMIPGDQLVTFERKNWGIQCYETLLPVQSQSTVVDAPASPK